MTDVLVVGGGLAGCAVGWGLARRGRDVLVLERAEQLGPEASAQNAGMVRLLGEDPAERALALRTHRYLDEHEGLARRTGAWLGLAHETHHLHDAVAHVLAAGIEVRSETPDLPALRGADVRQGWWCPGAFLADPHALIAHLARGLQVRRRAAVSSLVVEGDRCVGVLLSTGERLDAGAVVLAAGAWAGRLARTARVSRPLFPIRRHLLGTAPHPLSHPDHPWFWMDDRGLYARPEAGGWLISGCDEAVDVAGPRGPVDPEERARIHAKLERTFPAIADVRFVSGWTGLRTFAPDRRPVLGQDPERPGLWWAAGLGGFGVTSAIGVGEALSAWLCGEEVPWLSRSAVSPGRFYPRRWPIRPTGDLASLRLVPGRAD